MKRISRDSAATRRSTLKHWVQCLGLLSAFVAASGCGGGGTGGDPINSVPADLNAAALSWEKPTTNEDGSPMTDLTGYQIYYAQTTPVTTDNSESISVLSPIQTSYVVADLAPGTYYFTVTAVNLQGSESVMSNEASKTIF